MSSGTSLWFVLHGSSSVGLTLLNKQLGSAGQNQLTILALQSLGCAFVTYICHHIGLVTLKPIKREHFTASLWVAFLYTFMLFTSMRGLGLISVPLVMVGRNLTPMSTAIAEAIFLGARFSLRTFLSLLVIFIGALVYGQHDLSVSMEGAIYIAVNLALVATQSMAEKKLLRKIAGEQTASGISLYRNLIAVPLFFLLAVFVPPPGNTTATHVSLFAWSNSWLLVVLLLTCILSFTMGLATFSLQSLVSGTTLMVANVIYKFLSTLSSFLFFSVPFSSPVALAGLFISFTGASWYVFEQSRSSTQRTLPTTTTVSTEAEDV